MERSEKAENNFNTDNVVEQYSHIVEFLSGICDKHPELMTDDMQKKLEEIKAVVKVMQLIQEELDG